MEPTDLPSRLETARLILRPYRDGDGRDYYTACRRNRKHLLPYEADNPALGVETVEDAKELVQDFSLAWDNRRAFFLGAWDKQTGAWVAQLVLSVVSARPVEFAAGYWVDESHEGRGYVSEALRAVLGLAFGPLKAHRVRVMCSEDNTRSLAVAERLGFVREACLRQAARTCGPDGTPANELIYGMLKREYEERLGADDACRGADITGPRGDRITFRRVSENEHELMSLLTARLFLDTIAVSYRGYCTPDNLAARNVWTEARECHEWLNDAQGRMTAAFGRDGRLVGYAAYCPNESEPREYDWSLEGFFVLPESQGHGIGTRLLSAAADDMAGLGARRLVVATFSGSDADRYYRRTGAKLLFEEDNKHFGKVNRVSFLGWELPALQGELRARTGR